MDENEVINDLGDIRAYAIGLVEHPKHTETHHGIVDIIKIIDEKMDKYRGKEVTING